ncbi:hypothetical protein GCM10010149_18270 [Nonomuraea roseoviolacea subsp. roseoviolacea]
MSGGEGVAERLQRRVVLGLVERLDSVDIELTPQGAALRQHALDIPAEIARALPLTEEENAVLRQLLAKLGAAGG